MIPLRPEGLRQLGDEKDAGGSGPPSPIIFVVDDDHWFRAAMSRLLRSAGYQARVFSSPASFLSRTPATHPACLILDLSMPGHSGIELQETLTRAGDETPIVFVSGHGDVQQSVRAMKGGAVDFLTKPVARRDLLDAIERALAGAAQRRAEREQRASLEARLHRLSPREHQVFAMVVTGMINKQIAFNLGTTIHTVKVHRGRVMAKMGADSVTTLVRMAGHLGITALPSPDSGGA